MARELTELPSSVGTAEVTPWFCAATKLTKPTKPMIAAVTFMLMMVSLTGLD